MASELLFLDDPGKRVRVAGARYTYTHRGSGTTVLGIWSGIRWHCEHDRQRNHCKACGELCEHGRERSVWKVCGGSQICEDGRVRRRCKACTGTKRRRLDGV